MKNQSLHKIIVVFLLAVLLAVGLIWAIQPAHATNSKNDSPKTEWTIDPTSVDRLMRVSRQTERLYFFEDGKLVRTLKSSTSSGPIEPRNIHPKKPHDHIGVFTVDSKERTHW
jgi:hypothetical protein